MIQFADKGEPSLLLLSVPEEYGEGGKSSECFCVPVLSRSGGFLVCIPRGCFSEETLVDMLAGDEANAVVGPSKGVTVSLCEEGLDGSPMLVGASSNSLLVDLSDDALAWLREYDVSVEVTEVKPFSESYPNSVPLHSELVLVATEWVTNQGSERVNFYSALEEPEGVAPVVMKASSKKTPAPKRISNAQVLDQLSTVLNQMKALTARQEQLEQAGTGLVPAVSGPAFSSTAAVPPVSAGFAALGSAPPPVAFAKVAKVVGPPPRVRQPALVLPQQESPPLIEVPTAEAEPESIVKAISMQSSAITALVAHLANTADPLSELQGGGQSFGTTKGVQRREKMQSDLASGTSTFYLQMMQQLHRRMFPAKPVPRTISELQHLSFLDYLKETGGYRGNKEAGILMWLIGHILDAAAVEDMHQVRERLALLVVSLEQSVLDKGDWQIAFLLSLAEDPPLSVYQERSSVVSPYGRPFSNLVPSAWSAVVLAYVKELEILTTKKTEVASPKKSSKANEDSEDPSPTPKRKPRYPKKPHGDVVPPKAK